MNTLREAMAAQMKKPDGRIPPLIKCPLCQPGPLSYAGIVLNLVCRACLDQIAAARS